MVFLCPFPHNSLPSPRLADEEMPLWCAGLNPAQCQVAKLGQVLSQEERERAARYRFERDRRRFTVTRGLLRTLIGAYLSTDPGELQFTFGAKGKPEIAGGSSSTSI